jgi:hypothetical protein
MFATHGQEINTLVQVAASQPGREGVCLLGPAAASLQGRVAACQPVLAEACTPDRVLTLIVATFPPGQCSWKSWKREA